MRESIIPDALDRDVYLVLNDFGGAFGGLAWPETDVAHTDRATLMRRCDGGDRCRARPVSSLGTTSPAASGNWWSRS